MAKVVLILNSDKDANQALKITEKLSELNIQHETHIVNVYNKTRKILEILERLENEENLVLITVSDKSNTLSGICAANSQHPVIACPSFNDDTNMCININSTLQMPNYVPVLTVLNPINAALACAKILRIEVE